MANWYQRRPSDDAKLIMLLKMGKIDLAIASLELLKHHCERESDEIPEQVKKHLRELRDLDMVPTVDDMLQSLKTKRRNRGGVAPRGATGCHVVPDKRREEKRGEETTIESSPSPNGEGSDNARAREGAAPALVAAPASRDADYELFASMARRATA